MTTEFPDHEFDAHAKERALAREARSWDTQRIEPALAGDIPVIDVSDVVAGAASDAVIEQINRACRDVGFYYLVGHRMMPADLAEACDLSRQFHDLSDSDKQSLAMDQAGANVPGAGYLAVGHRKLPRRATGNSNEAFIIKRDIDAALADNLWPPDRILPGFRSAVERLAKRFEMIALELLPLYAQALNMAADYFAPAFVDPLFRLRLTHYPPMLAETSAFGIAPHVDTTFFTLLVQDGPGLHVYSERRDCWISVPPLEGALVVNTGELLKQWSNDEFVSVKHFANNSEAQSRYSVPFFFNATSDFSMTCIPSCCGPERPAKYPPISYRQSQGIVQGE